MIIIFVIMNKHALFLPCEFMWSGQLLGFHFRASVGHCLSSGFDDSKNFIRLERACSFGLTCVQKSISSPAWVLWAGHGALHVHFEVDKVHPDYDTSRGWSVGGGKKRTHNIVPVRAVVGISNVRVQNTRLHTKGSTAPLEVWVTKQRGENEYIHGHLRLFCYCSERFWSSLKNVAK